MKIAFINQPWNFCPSPDAGSVSIWTHEVARRLASRSTVVVYARRGPQDPAVECKDGLIYRRISVAQDHLFHKIAQKALSTRSTKDVFTNRLYYPLFTRRIARDLASQNCDVVHVQSFLNTAILIKRRNPHSRVILHMHCDWLLSLGQSHTRKRLEGISRIAGCSDHICNGVRIRFPHYASRCRTLHNGVSHPWPSSSREWKPENNADHILFVGRISPEKGLHVLLRAFERVCEKRPHTRLIIAGPDATAPIDFLKHERDNALKQLQPWFSGNYLMKLQKILPDAIASRVSFIGALPQNDLGPIYHGCTILVNPSFIESFGMSPLEAMLYGRAVVATRVGGVPEVVKHEETGLLVPPGDEAALANAIVSLLTDPLRRERMGEAGKQRALRYFTWEKVAQQAWEIYQDLISEG